MVLAVTTLDQLRTHATGTVVRVDGDDAIARRLSDLGFWPGTEVELVRKAPFGDPLQFVLRGFRLALRRREARLVVILAAGPSGGGAG